MRLRSADTRWLSSGMCASAGEPSNTCGHDRRASRCARIAAPGRAGRAPRLAGHRARAAALADPLEQLVQAVQIGGRALLQLQRGGRHAVGRRAAAAHLHEPLCVLPAAPPCAPSALLHPGAGAQAITPCCMHSPAAALRLSCWNMTGWHGSTRIESASQEWQSFWTSSYVALSAPLPLSVTCDNVCEPGHNLSLLSLKTIALPRGSPCSRAYAAASAASAASARTRAASTSSLLSAGGAGSAGSSVADAASASRYHRPPSAAAAAGRAAAFPPAAQALAALLSHVRKSNAFSMHCIRRGAPSSQGGRPPKSSWDRHFP